MKTTFYSILETTNAMTLITVNYGCFINGIEHEYLFHCLFQRVIKILLTIKLKCMEQIGSASFNLRRASDTNYTQAI